VKASMYFDGSYSVTALEHGLETGARTSGDIN
jgi:hypothetical protein